MTLVDYRRRLSAEKRAAILRAARAAFVAEGFRGASIEAIAAAAGVSTATVYAKFADKTDLFEAVATEALERLVAPEADPTDDTLKRLRLLAESYAQLLSAPETRGLMRMLIAEANRNPDLALRFYDRVKSRISETFAAALVDATRAGRLEGVRDYGEAAGQIQGMIEHATLMRGLVLGDEAASARAASTIAAEALRTFLARWGRN